MILSSLLMCHLILPTSADPWKSVADDLSSVKRLGLPPIFAADDIPLPSRTALSAGVADDNAVYLAVEGPLAGIAARLPGAASVNLDPAVEGDVAVGAACFRLRTAAGDVGSQPVGIVSGLCNPPGDTSYATPIVNSENNKELRGLLSGATPPQSSPRRGGQAGGAVLGSWLALSASNGAGLHSISEDISSKSVIEGSFTNSAMSELPIPLAYSLSTGLALDTSSAQGAKAWIGSIETITSFERLVANAEPKAPSVTPSPLAARGGKPSTQDEAIAKQETKAFLAGSDADKLSMATPHPVRNSPASPQGEAPAWRAGGSGWDLRLSQDVLREPLTDVLGEAISVNLTPSLGEPVAASKTMETAGKSSAIEVPAGEIGASLAVVPEPPLLNPPLGKGGLAGGVEPTTPLKPASTSALLPTYALLTFTPQPSANPSGLKSGALRASVASALQGPLSNLAPALPHLSHLTPVVAAKKAPLPHFAPIAHLAANVSLVMGNISLARQSTQAPAGQGGTISMSFSNVDVSQALVALAEKTGANIVYAGKDKAQITLRLMANSTEEAVRAISSAAGLVYRKLEKVYVVATPDGMKAALAPYASSRNFNVPSGQADAMAKKVQDSLPYATATALGDTIVVKGAPEDISEAARIVQRLTERNDELHPTSEVIMLNHAKADDIAKAVKTIYPGVEVASAPGPGEAPGLVRISGPAALVDQAKGTIVKMDEQAPSAKPEEPIVALPYHIKYTSAPELVDLLKKAMPEVDATPGPEVYQPPKATFNPLSSTFFGSSGGGGGGGGATGTQGAQGQGGGQGGVGGGSAGGSGSTRKPGDRAADLVIRGPRSMVLQAMALLESLDLKPIQIWVDVTVSDVSPSFTENLGIDWNLNNTITAGERGGVGASGLGVGKITRSPYTFQAALNASIQKGEAKLIADPKVQVSDNDDASVFIGQTFNIVLTTTAALGATTQNTTSVPVGVILLIHPRVNADGNITLHVNPVVSTVDSVENGLPQTSNREAETTLVVKDGQTMLIGGLIKDEYSRSISEVPFLSKIPILGELFRNRNTNKTRQDVLISITPHIVKE